MSQRALLIALLATVTAAGACPSSDVTLWPWPVQTTHASVHVHTGDLLFISLPQPQHLYWLDERQGDARQALQALRDDDLQAALVLHQLAPAHATDLTYRALRAGHWTVDLHAYRLGAATLVDDQPAHLRLDIDVEDAALAAAAPMTKPARKHVWFWQHAAAATTTATPCPLAPTDR